MPRIVFDKNKCVGCGTCQGICPENWEIVGCHARSKSLTNFNLEKNKEVEKYCPVRAIRIEE